MEETPVPPTNEPIVQARAICKSYRTGSVSTPVLSDVEFSVARGECLFLVGPSGSGKTTLLSILGCVLSADSGHLEILGDDVTHYSRHEQARFRRERIGFVFQRFHLFSALTAGENVAVPLKLLGWRSAAAREQAAELLTLVGLTDFVDKRVTQLSMGQRQRVAVARALAGDPALILADEPTASLDAEAGIHAMEILHDLCRRLQKTVIVVTHDPRIHPWADRILTLRNGRVGEDSSSQDSAANSALAPRRN